MPKKKLIIIVGGVLLLAVLGGGGFFAYKKFFAKPSEPAAAEEKGKEEAKSDKHKEGEAKGKEGGKEGEAKGKEGGKEGGKEKGAASKYMGPTSTLTFVVNLADPGRPRFLKIHMDMELDDEASLQEFEAIRPKARDSIITILGSHTTDELQSVGDKQKLKNEVLHRLNSLMTSGKVREVYFSEFMVQ